MYKMLLSHFFYPHLNMNRSKFQVVKSTFQTLRPIWSQYTHQHHSSYYNSSDTIFFSSVNFLLSTPKYKLTHPDFTLYWHHLVNADFSTNHSLCIILIIDPFFYRNRSYLSLNSASQATINRLTSTWNIDVTIKYSQKPNNRHFYIINHINPRVQTFGKSVHV